MKNPSLKRYIDQADFIRSTYQVLIQHRLGVTISRKWAGRTPEQVTAECSREFWEIDSKHFPGVSDARTSPVSLAMAEAEKAGRLPVLRPELKALESALSAFRVASMEFFAHPFAVVRKHKKNRKPVGIKDADFYLDPDRKEWEQASSILARAIENVTQLAAALEVADKRGNGPSGKQGSATEKKKRRCMPKEIIARAEKHISRNGYPGFNTLHELMECSVGTLKKAINQSPKLMKAKVEHEAKKRSGNTR